jgi:hypothetical protein
MLVGPGRALNPSERWNEYEVGILNREVFQFS